MSLFNLRKPSRALFALLATLVIFNTTMLSALAVQVPRPGSSLFIQTSGPNAGLGIGDYYTSPAGGDTDHLFMIRVPSDWPAGTPVTVALYDPEVGGVSPVSPTAADEVRNAADTADFRLESPGGATISSVTYSDLSTNGVWTELATFDPGVTGTGSYLLRVRVSDDDDNSWRVDASHDPDCVVGTPCTPSALVDGNESASAPSGSGSLAVGVIRTSWQHEGPGSTCQDHYFYVNGATPRPLRAHNFDMDGNGSVTYTSPTGASIAGTVSGNAAWNNSSNAQRAGDVLPDVNGWWRATICISSTNQYVFESPSAGPSFPEPQPAPRIEVTKSDAVTGALVGDQLIYTITVDNVSDEDALPDAAYEVVAVDDLPAGLTFVSCSSVAFDCAESAGVVTATLTTPLQPGTAASFDVVATVGLDAPVSLTNDVIVDFEDHLGAAFESVLASDTDGVDFRPALAMDVTGPVHVLRGDDAALTYTLQHGPGSDQSPVSSVSVTCARCATLSYVSGDSDSDGVLDWGETWSYDAVVATGAGDPATVLATAVASGQDLNGEAVAASATGEVDLIEPASVSGVVFEDLNGNGTLDPGEPGIGGGTIELTGPSGPLTVVPVDGAHQFDHLAPGSYTVSVSGVSAPLTPTTPESLDFELAAGESRGGVDFGYAAPVTISGTVFTDLDHDGLRDSGEPGLGGVILRLVDTSATVLAVVTASADGTYSFSALPGDYAVEVVSGLPTGWELSAPGARSTGFLISAAAATGVDFGVSNLAPVMVEGSETIAVGEQPSPLSATDPEGSGVVFSLVGGSLPVGLHLSSDGSFEGVAGIPGTYPIEVQVCDTATPQACAVYSHEIVVGAVQVEATEQLPFTGAGMDGLTLAGVLLLAAGSTAVARGYRAEEQARS